MSEFELYMEKFRVLTRKGGKVFETQSDGHGWFDMNVVDTNKPNMTNIIYAPPSKFVAFVPIRKKVSND